MPVWPHSARTIAAQSRLRLCSTESMALDRTRTATPNRGVPGVRLTGYGPEPHGYPGQPDGQLSGLSLHRRLQPPGRCCSPSAEPTSQRAQEPEATSDFALPAIHEGTGCLLGSRNPLIRADSQAELRLCSGAVLTRGGEGGATTPLPASTRAPAPQSSNPSRPTFTRTSPPRAPGLHQGETGENPRELTRTGSRHVRSRAPKDTEGHRRTRSRHGASDQRQR